jgi:hypothetical protein
VPGVILIVQQYELSLDYISEIGMVCGQASFIGEYDGYIKAKNNKRKKGKRKKRKKKKRKKGES